MTGWIALMVLTSTMAVDGEPGGVPRIEIFDKPKRVPSSPAHERARRWGQQIETRAVGDRELRAKFLTLSMREREVLLDVWPDVVVQTKRTQRAYGRLLEVQHRWIAQEQTTRRLSKLRKRMEVDTTIPRGADGGLMVGAYFAGLGGMVAFRLLYGLLVAAALSSGDADSTSAILILLLDVLVTPAATAGMAKLVVDMSDYYDYSFLSGYVGAAIGNVGFLVLAGLASSSEELLATFIILNLAAIPLGASVGFALRRTPVVRSRVTYSLTPEPLRIPRARIARISFAF